MAKRDDKNKQSQTTNTPKKALGAFAQPEYNLFEARNAILPQESKQQQYEQILTELKGYRENKSTSAVADVRQGQDELLEKVIRALEQNQDGRGVYVAVTKFFSEADLKMDDQLSKIGLRLIRLYELQRQGTTDVLEFPDTKNILKDYGFELLRYYKGQDKQRAIFILKNVENAQAGSTQIGLDELEQTRDMVQDALRAELKEKSQAVMPPHQIESVQGDMKVIQPDVSPAVVLYLRVFESLTIAIMKQQAITKEKEVGLELKREEVLNSLDRLGGSPGISLTNQTRDRFMDKMSTMTLDQLKFFDFKILDLLNRYNKQGDSTISPEQANAEITGWLDKKFDRQELHADLEARKRRNREDEELKMRQNKIVEFPLKKAVKNPIEPWEQAA